MVLVKSFGRGENFKLSETLECHNSQVQTVRNEFPKRFKRETPLRLRTLTEWLAHNFNKSGFVKWGREAWICVTSFRKWILEVSICITSPCKTASMLMQQSEQSWKRKHLNALGFNYLFFNRSSKQFLFFNCIFEQFVPFHLILFKNKNCSSKQTGANILEFYYKSRDQQKEQRSWISMPGVRRNEKEHNAVEINGTDQFNSGKSCKNKTPPIKHKN